LDKEERDLRHVIYGINTAKGEPSGLWQDNGTGHGTRRHHRRPRPHAPPHSARSIRKWGTCWAGSLFVV
jgi:hypothetical protein